jgi:hypothetical protein
MSKKGSSSRGNQQAAGSKKWDHIRERNFDLSPDSGDLNNLIRDFDHKDFRLSRAWICFSGQHFHGNIKTNHAYLKFDFKPCNNHPWRGFKLDADPLETSYIDDKSGNEYTCARVELGLKEWEGPPEGAMFCKEVETRFDCVSHGTTLGRFIEILKGAKLLKFDYSTITSSTEADVLVGCRDYV